MKKVLTIFLFVALGISGAKASHIVGGEFEVLHREGFNYTINLILYFDAVNGNPGAFDNEIEVSIFRKRDDGLVRNYILPYAGTTRVDYFQPSCSKGEVVTDKIIYSEEFYLNPNTYDDPEGYYIVWQRCCRNYTITNIFSSDPQFGQHAGQTFYLEFPPVVDESGDPFVNSSPQLFPPLNDYACPFRPYWVDFAGVDVDGDSLSYTLVEPLSTQFNTALPAGGQNLSGPYPTTLWKPGFGMENIMNGFPDLKISTDGFVTVTPLSQGLFVFAVKVDEFRNGIKIGEVRRDFQMLVVDRCPEAQAPRVLGRKLNESLYYDNAMSVTFSNSVSDEERCVVVEVSDPDASQIIDNFSEEVRIKAIPLGFKDNVSEVLPEERCVVVEVSDPDASQIIDNFTEEVRIKAIPLGFKDNVSEVLPEEISATLVNGSKASFDICFPECPFVDEGPFRVGIVVFDDACALPLSDTLKITVNIEPPPNNDPYFTTPDVDLTVIEQKDGFFSTDLIGRDDDNDSLYISFFPQGFVLEEFGMSLEKYYDEPGEIRTRFNWNFDCIQTSFDGRTDFRIYAILDDYDYCLLAHPDTTIIDLKVILPPNTFPEISADELGAGQKYFLLERELNDVITFETFSEDLDNDPIRVDGLGANFDMGLLGARFPSKDGTGVPGLSSQFEWYLDCFRLNLDKQDSFRFYLFVEDFDYCNITSKDTLTVDVLVNEPENLPPDVTFKPLNDKVSLTDEVSGEVTVGDPVIINVSALDPNRDNVTLELLRVEGDNLNQDFSFKPAAGFRQASSKLIWVPSCESLIDDAPSAEYRFVFKVTDDFCLEPSDEEVVFTLHVKDIEAQPIQFSPPNFFSPNGDQYNAFFALEWEDEDGTKYTTGLPKDNCAGTFIDITILNRWGRQVYQSDKRDFKWFGDDQASGVYYYYVRYTNRVFKGTITMLY